MTKFLARLSQAFAKKQSTPPAQDNFGIGTSINQRYRLDAEIGHGGMGVIYRAYDLSSERDVAIKIINAATANVLSLGQFAREAEITLRLKHPHIVATYEAGESESSPYLVMELLQGNSLAESRGFTYSKILDIAKQICDALEYIHNQGFVYHDLKPGNVILEKRGFETFVKLLDFGLARPRGEAYLPTESSLAGSSFYLAPELITGQPADIGSDLYALGVTLYEMITGRVPFSNFDEQKILSQHLTDPVTPPSDSRNDVPPALESIILRLLEKDPKDRFTSAQEVHHALDQITLTTARGNLPKTSTEIIGHENEIAQIKQLLESSQLVTLLNDKESLALAVANQLADQFADGAWLVQLDLVHDPMMLVQTVASIFDVRENPNRPLTISLIETLREKNLLLLLSHCELFPQHARSLSKPF